MTLGVRGHAGRHGVCLPPLAPQAMRSGPLRRVRRARSLVAIALALVGPAGCRDAKPGSRPPPLIPAPPVRLVDATAAAGPPGVPTRVTWFPDVAEIAARVAVLADPALRGRGSGTADEAAAADKVAAWFREAGLEPAGAGGGYLAPFTVRGERSQNVIGVIRGSDPALGHVVIGAHVDHLGVRDGVVYPGADDDASGIAGLCAIAEALSHAGQRPRHTIVVVGFGAEEDGLLGSEAYVASPALPLDHAVLMINLDMIGRARFLSGEVYALAHTVVAYDAIGALTSPGAADLVTRARLAARTVGRPLVSPSDFGPIEDLVRPAMETRADQASFAAVGIRYLWLSTSMHDDYHQPTDTADKVDPATIAAVGRIVVEVVLGLADPPGPPRPSGPD